MGALRAAGAADPARIEPGGSLARLLVARAKENPEFRFLWVEDDGPWTFGGLAASAASVRARLEDAGVTRGTRVVVRAGNEEAFLPAVNAVWACGGVAVLVHPGAPPAELARVVATMDVALIVAGASPVPESAVPVVEVGEVRAAGDGVPYPEPLPLAGDDPAVVLLTSGSTGAPKGVVLTHDNAWANVKATLSAFRADTSPSPLPTRWRPPNLIANPVSHSGGLVRMLFAFYVGRGVVLLRKFNAPGAKRAIDQHGIDNLTINPTMLRMLLDDLPPEADLGPVRYVSSGTAPLPDALRTRFEERFGVPVLQSYGQTESFGALSIERATDVLAGRRRPGSVGRPLPGITVRVVDELGHDVTPGAVGELWARSPASSSALLGGETASPLDADGWLHTGDLVRTDEDGYLYVVGRKRSLILCGGFSIVPEELEALLGEVDGVREVAVVGLPDDRLGEIPVAVVVGDTTPDRVMEAARARCSPYKRPRRVVLADALPRLASGKVDKTMAARLVAQDGGG